MTFYLYILYFYVVVFCYRSEEKTGRAQKQSKKTHLFCVGEDVDEGENSSMCACIYM